MRNKVRGAKEINIVVAKNKKIFFTLIISINKKISLPVNENKY